jgi:hypothetical protein
VTALAVQERFRPNVFGLGVPALSYRLTITFHISRSSRYSCASDVLNDLNGALWNMARDSMGRLNGLNVYSTGIS